MNKLRLFSNEISPSCSYCKYGDLSRDRRSILCAKCGVTQPGDFCKKFVYAPLKRVPRRAPKLQSFDPSDFEL